MVDYNLQVPGIAPAQTPQINPMQMIPLMQQQQMNNLLLQERTRNFSRQNALAQAMNTPGFDISKPEAWRQMLAIGGPDAASMVAAAARANADLRAGQTSAAQTEKTVQETLQQRIEFGRKLAAAISPNDREGYTQLFSVYKPSADKLGIPMPSPDKWNAETKEQMLTTIDTFNERLKEARVPRAVTYVETPEGPAARFGALKPGEVPINIPVGQAPKGAGAGWQPNSLANVPSAPVPANRMADINRRSALYADTAPPLPPQRPEAAYGTLPARPLQLQATNTFGVGATPAQVAMIEQTAAGQRALGEAPRVTPSATGRITDRVEPQGGFVPAQSAEAEREQRTRREAAVKARTEAGGHISTMEDTIRAAQAVKSLKPEAKETITGLAAHFTPLSAQARDAETKLKNLEGALTAFGRSVAAESGKPGAMQVQEWEIMRDQVAAMRTSKMNATDLDRQIDIITKKAADAMKRWREGYELSHEDMVKKDPRLALPKPSVKLDDEPTAGAIQISPDTQRLLDKYK